MSQRLLQSVTFQLMTTFFGLISSSLYCTPLVNIRSLSPWRRPSTACIAVTTACKCRYSYHTFDHCQSSHCNLV